MGQDDSLSRALCLRLFAPAWPVCCWELLDLPEASHLRASVLPSYTSRLSAAVFPDLGSPGSNTASHSRGRLGGTTWSQGLRVTAATVPARWGAFLFLLQGCQHLGFRAWSTQGSGGPLGKASFGLKELLGPAARCFWGWRLSVLWRQSLRGDKLARLRCAPGCACLYGDENEPSPASARVLGPACDPENSYSSLWPYRQPWGDSKFAESRAWECHLACPPSSPPWCWEVYRVWTVAWENSLSTLVWTKTVEGKRFSFCGDWGFLTEVDIILCDDSPESRQGHRAGSVCIPGWFAADADLGCSVLSWPHTLAFWVAWLGCVIFFFFSRDGPNICEFQNFDFYSVWFEERPIWKVSLLFRSWGFVGRERVRKDTVLGGVKFRTLRFEGLELSRGVENNISNSNQHTH